MEDAHLNLLDCNISFHDQDHTRIILVIWHVQPKYDYHYTFTVFRDFTDRQFSKSHGGLFDFQGSHWIQLISVWYVNQLEDRLVCSFVVKV